MESALALWKNNIVLDTNTICDKARQLYSKFKDGVDDNPDDSGPGSSMAYPTKPTEYNASKAWFDKFFKGSLTLRVYPCIEKLPLLTILLSTNLLLRST